MGHVVIEYNQASGCHFHCHCLIDRRPWRIVEAPEMGLSGFVVHFVALSQR